MPSDTTPPAATEPLFSAIVTPNASLGPRGFAVVMALLAGVSFAAGMMFLAKGAWPVLPFLGLDVLLVWLAFRAYRDKARAYEEVRVDEDEVLVRRVSAGGHVQEYRLNPYWVRVKRTIVEDEGVVRVSLASHGKALDVAHYLSPPERATFADALERALARARGGRPVEA